MKQVTVISGKGGTGKTSLVASFAVLAKGKVMADCDVDAADLHLLLRPAVKSSTDFRGMDKAVIDQEKCIGCGKCWDICRYDAILKHEQEGRPRFEIDPIECEGCAFCSHICPVDAISMVENISGKLFISETDYGPMVHAKLGIAEENSGKLVALVRQEAKELAEKDGYGLIIIDGPPGIGCPVISSLTGADLAVIVTEPTPAGMHDLGRAADLTQHFGIRTLVVVNKYDLNISNTEAIAGLCRARGIELVSRIPFDISVTKAMVEGKPVVEYCDGRLVDEIRRLWERIEGELR